MENNKTEKKELTQEERLKRQKFLIYPAVALVGILIVYFIFAPSSTDEQKALQGFNTEMPLPTDNDLEEDKAKLYEQDRLSKRQRERNEIRDLASLFDRENSDSNKELDLTPSQEQEPTQKSYYSSSNRHQNSSASDRVVASTSAYRDINTTLGSFYETPKSDPEKEEMKQQIEQMKQQLQTQQQIPKDVTMDDQMALLEKSYELAAKYNNQGGQNSQPTVTERQKEVSYKNGKAQITNIGQVTTRITSSLSQPMEDSVFIAELSKSRNLSFNTAIGIRGAVDRNTISACVHTNQTIIDGQSIRMRLLEPMKVGDNILPKNAIVTGIGKIQGDRLFINITTLEHSGTITPTELLIHDTDGQEGIYIPNSMEINAIKEVAANLGGSMGTTINLNQQSAGDQILTDLGKGAIQGLSQYVAKKMREVKVHLKEGYKVMIYQDKQ